MNSEIYRLLAHIFNYPNPVLPETVDRLLTLLQEEAPQATLALEEFRSALGARGIPGLQEIYIQTFDFRADCALYIGHHLFGESGRHGVFMAELAGRYSDLRLPETEELPDHLSCVLRYLAAIQDSNEADELIHACLLPALSRIIGSKALLSSPYLPILTALRLLLQQSETNISQTGELSWITSSSSPFPMLP